jgi:hypothetical protein
MVATKKNKGGRPRKEVTKAEKVHVRIEEEDIALLDKAIFRERDKFHRETTRAGYLRELLLERLSDLKKRGEL